jgi:bacterioferritin
MKGHDRIIDNLNELLADELAAINQYSVHSEMCANWGYQKLHKVLAARAIVEMKHAEQLIGRIIFLEGTPNVSTLNDIAIGSDVPRQHANDLGAEQRAVRGYNAGIRLAAELGDNGSREMLDTILTAEEKHVDYIEAQLEQIKQMGLQPYLGEQVD